jgi:NAD-dependent deacetylase
MKKHIVILSGAGVSAESGLLTFRDSGGLWEGHRVEDVASPEGWQKHPQLVLDFYNKRRHDALAAQPNKAHLLIAKLENHYNVSVITQNIDDLHERGGSKKVLHLHGEITKCRSVTDDLTTYPYSKDLQLGDVDEAGQQLRPFIVWFGEPVPMIEKAATICANADIFIVVGTSLQVYPAAGLINYVPPLATCYVVDKNIPDYNFNRKIIPINDNATIGMESLFKRLTQ